MQTNKQTTSPPAPPVSQGFEQINRFYDRHRKIWTAKILPGEFYVTQENEVISTVLGSCISVCIRDPFAGVGGMNHFMLPSGEATNSIWADCASRYGNWAMEFLMNELFKRGAHRNRLEVKVFGGGQVLSNVTDIGGSNIRFALSYLAAEGLSIAAQDVGGYCARKVVFMPTTGKVQVKKIYELHNDTIIKREASYSAQLKEHGSDTGDIELFS